MARKITLLVLLGALLIGAAELFMQYERPEERELNETASPRRENTYADATTELSFRYPDSYTLRERGGDANGSVKTLLLVHANDLASFENPPESGEGPAVISIQIFRNDKRERPLIWANEHPALSSLPLAFGEPRETAIGGAQAVRYSADGLYASEVAVVTHSSFVYLFMGQYVDENSPTYRDFESILSSVAFLPPPG